MKSYLVPAHFHLYLSLTHPLSIVGRLGNSCDGAWADWYLDKSLQADIWLVIIVFMEYYIILVKSFYEFNLNDKKFQLKSFNSNLKCC